MVSSDWRNFLISSMESVTSASVLYLCTNPTAGIQTWQALPFYSEQTAWTPTITGGTIAGTGTYSSQVGYYTHIGNMLFVTCHIVWTDHTGTGDMTITNLPFAARNSSDYHPEGTINPSNIPLPGNATSCRGDIAAGTSIVSMYVLRSNNTNSPVQMNASGTLHLTIAYLT